MNSIKLLLFTSTILLYSSCKETDEEQKTDQTVQETPTPTPTPVPVPTTTYYKAIFSIDSVPAQDQYYRYKKIKDGFEIAEHGVFLSDSTIIAKARLRFANNEYEEIEINFDNGRIKSDVVVEKNREGVYYSYLNSNLVDSIVTTDSVVLFDGPNPSFDYVNSQHLLLNVNSAESNVVLINWVSGSLSTERMLFKTTIGGFSVLKTGTQRSSIIILNDLPLAIKSSKQNKEDHEFSTLKENPGYFD